MKQLRQEGFRKFSEDLDLVHRYLVHMRYAVELPAISRPGDHQPHGSNSSPIGSRRTADVDIVDAELARSSYENQDLVMDGVKTGDPMHRILGGILVILALVAHAAGIITRHRLPCLLSDLAGGNAAMTPTSFPLVNMSYWTLADAIINEGS
jgi:hypothetical protein